MNKIEEFINRRFKNTEAKWFDGNCYYFAVILKSRFPNLNIYYDPIEGHFMAGENEEYYDASGRIIPSSQPYLFEDLKKIDPLYYSHIKRDCIM